MTAQAKFVERTECINCGSTHLSVLSHGRFAEQPLIGFLTDDPWGESPVPHLQTAEWMLVQCRDCRQVFHKFILDEEWNERRFARWMSEAAIKEFESRHNANRFAVSFQKARGHVAHALRIENFTRGLRGNDPVRLLDFGCGFGDFIATCQDFGYDAVGIDRAKPRSTGAKVKIHPSLDDIGDERFHAITLFEVLEHVDRPADILRLMHERIVRGGILILETPDCTGVTDIKSHNDYLKVHPLEHINAFTHITLKSIAERNGFKLFPRGPAWVTSERNPAIRHAAKHILQKEGRSTQLYFRAT